MSLKVIDGTPTAISKFLREKENKMKNKQRRKELRNLFDEWCNDPEADIQEYFYKCFILAEKNTIKEVLDIIKEIEPKHPYLDDVKLFIRELKQKIKRIKK